MGLGATVIRGARMGHFTGQEDYGRSTRRWKDRHCIECGKGVSDEATRCMRCAGELRGRLHTIRSQYLHLRTLDEQMGAVCRRLGLGT